MSCCRIGLTMRLLDTIPRDIRSYCPDYSIRTPEERLEFWGLFISVISWMESSHRTEHFYEELGITDSTGKNVVSRGLLQFSYESARSYLSRISAPEDLHDPATSLETGVNAIRRFIIQDGVISAGKKGEWRGAARYWSVLRNNPKHRQIKAWLTHADYAQPQNNLIPPPPHVSEQDYEPWIKKVFPSVFSPRKTSL